MRIKKLQIKNFKSLVDFELEDLKPFCAFVGPNASGKSNIFEALEFVNYLIKYSSEAPGFFGGLPNIYSYNPISLHLGIPPVSDQSMDFNVEFGDGVTINYTTQLDIAQNKIASISGLGFGAGTGVDGLLPFFIRNFEKRKVFIDRWTTAGFAYENTYEQFADNFTRLFISKAVLNRTPSQPAKLSPDASNLSQVIGSIFESEKKQTDFLEWVRILIPELKDIKVRKSNIDGSFEFFVYEKSSEKPFPRALISDGTYNILSLIAAVQQSNEPQFLCIEEPENGLHPQAIELLVDFFREKCEEDGHHIWLNTHSQTLVRQLEIEEVILVNKVDGKTRAKQLTKADEVNIKTDEAWLTNALGGGVLWSK